MELEKLKSSAILLAFITTVVSTSFVVDNRYVHASEYDKLKDEIEESNVLNQNMINDLMTRQRIITLSDLIFDIQIKGDLNSVDAARLDRYKRELDHLQRK